MNKARQILELLKTAPESQLSERFRVKCEEFDGTDADLLNLFNEIYHGCCEASEFVKQLVNPKYTSKYINKDE